ncbi:serine-rich adhesin for platelets [Anastrepha ludens]|uniref:serine-rich adhesin for platelets n=1 Tax=Anastrepha ludens TaxID=28586 RepID=UPI0023AF6C92|nr:serine-rich adhesin for platelets [Anastrepha ludens]
MDKIALERAAASPVSPGSPTASHASSSASLSNGHKTHGVQKFCSKIRHKIEDNIAPRLTGKLYKSHKHSISMSSLNNVDSTSGKYTAISKQSTLPPLSAKVDQQTGTSFSSSSAHRRLTGMLKHQRQRIGKSTKVLNKREISAPIGKVATNSGIICPALNGKGNVVDTVVAQETAPNSSSSFESGTYVDSDEEYQLSLNLTKQSLEDEIFEELEKAAHDESKLNAVLKNFDRLLTDYNGQPVIVSEEEEKTMQRVECDVAVVEAAAAAQLELLALEPPVAFADNEILNKKVVDEVHKPSTTVEAATNVAEKSTDPMLDILEAKTAPIASQIPQVVELEIETLTHKQTISQLLPAVSPGKSVDIVVFDCPVNSSQISSNIDDNSLTTASAGVSDSTSPCSAPTATTSTENSFTPPQPPVRPKRLEKSKSSLAIPRRNAYQSSDTPTLRNIRYALAARSRSKSVWELTPNSAAAAANSKIPIFKALPLQKRSNSFCSTSLTEVIDKEKLIGTKKLVVEKRGGVNESATASKDLTVAKLNQRRQLTKDARSVSALSLGGKARSRSLSTTRTQQTPSSTSVQQLQTQSTAAQRAKRKSVPIEKLTRSNSRLQMERTKSSIGFNSTTLSTMGTRRTPSSISLSSSQHTSPSVSRTIALNSTGARKLHRSRDELLDKCLEKGQEILRKVESINTEGGMRKTTIASTLKTSGKAATLKTTTTSTQPKRATSTTAAATSSRTKVKTACSGSVALTGKITKDACNGTLRRTRVPPTNATTNISPATATATKQLKYANEEKVPQPQLEFCKIIPPVLGETSDKHTELLVNVVQAKLSNVPPSGYKPTVTQQLSQHQEANNLKEQLAVATKGANSYQTLHSAAPIEKLIKVDDINHINESDSDDSGHISNENDTTIHTLSTSTTSSVSLCESDIIEEEKSQQQPTAYKASNQNPISMHCKSNKISELLEKFEKQSHTSVQSSVGEQNIRATPTKLCTATRVAQLEAVQCIQTQVEFYPTYSKEVTIRLL